MTTSPPCARSRTRTPERPAQGTRSRASPTSTRRTGDRRRGGAELGAPQPAGRPAARRLVPRLPGRAPRRRAGASAGQTASSSRRTRSRSTSLEYSICLGLTVADLVQEYGLEPAASPSRRPFAPWCGRRTPRAIAAIALSRRASPRSTASRRGTAPKVRRARLAAATHASKRRRRAESNRCARLCRPLPNHSATAPRAPMLAGAVTDFGRAPFSPRKQQGGMHVHRWRPSDAHHHHPLAHLASLSNATYGTASRAPRARRPSCFWVIAGL